MIGCEQEPVNKAGTFRLVILNAAKGLSSLQARVRIVAAPLSNGPVVLIRAEGHRVLFGFWRGKRLREIERRLKPGGKYEMATVELREDEQVSAGVVRRLVKAAVGFNETIGDPTGV